jgi:ElaB/YqjD/DUF883 family membrane-anchored ribosome-binding protein
MADTDLKPLTDGDIVPPAATTNLQPATSSGTSTGDFAAGSGTDTDGTSRRADAKQAIRDGADKIGQQATDKLRTLADDGKARAGSALDQLAQLITDAATQVDEKLGEQYGQYARSAAGQVTGLSDTIRNKNVDELLEDARGLVKSSPAIAVGIAAALGFAVARLVQSGLDTQD